MINLLDLLINSEYIKEVFAEDIISFKLIGDIIICQYRNCSKLYLPEGKGYNNIELSFSISKQRASEKRLYNVLIFEVNNLGKFRSICHSNFIYKPKIKLQIRSNNEGNFNQDLDKQIVKVIKQLEFHCFSKVKRWSHRYTMSNNEYDLWKLEVSEL